VGERTILYYSFESDNILLSTFEPAGMHRVNDLPTFICILFIEQNLPTLYCIQYSTTIYHQYKLIIIMYRAYNFTILLYFFVFKHLYFRQYYVIANLNR